MASAIQNLADAGLQLARSIDKATAQRRAADEFWAKASHSLDSTCRFLKKKGPWLLGITPVVLTSIGIITPNAAHLLATALKAAGAP